MLILDRKATAAPSFAPWMAAREKAERLIRAEADDGQVLRSMDQARKLEVRAIAEIRKAASADVDPSRPYLFRFEGRTFLVMPDETDLEVDGQLASQIFEIDPARIVDH
jgi:hypothetical protein